MTESRANFWFYTGICVFIFSLTMIVCSVLTKNIEASASYVAVFKPSFILSLIMIIPSQWTKFYLDKEDYVVYLKYVVFSYWLGLGILLTGCFHFLPLLIHTAGPIYNMVLNHSLFLVIIGIALICDTAIVDMGSEEFYSRYSHNHNLSDFNNMHFAMIMHYASLLTGLVCAYYLVICNPIIDKMGIWGIVITFIGILCVPIYFASRYIYSTMPFNLEPKPPKKVDKVVAKSNLNSSN